MRFNISVIVCFFYCLSCIAACDGEPSVAGECLDLVGISADSDSIIEFRVCDSLRTSVTARYTADADDLYFFDLLANVAGQIIANGERSLPDRSQRQFVGVLRDRRIVELGQWSVPGGSAESDQFFFFGPHDAGESTFFLHVGSLQAGKLKNVTPLFRANPIYGSRPILVGTQYLAFFEENGGTQLLDTQSLQRVETELNDCIPQLALRGSTMICSRYSGKLDHFVADVYGNEREKLKQLDGVPFAYDNSNQLVYFSKREWSSRRMGEVQNWYVLDLNTGTTRSLERAAVINPISVVQQ